ncbi:MAG: glycosyltransferase family 2 protein [Deltaproteobacteria bacterium]|nr:glycosyltransferase family 2 protein [Deltaproteobacteria bacterium]
MEKIEESDVSVIIPAYNEAPSIGRVVAEILALHPGIEIIVIDDGSTDRTGDVAGEAGAVVYRHPYNIGNGAAIKSGIRIASGNVLVFMDGDGQHDTADLNELIRYFPEFDMVVGARSSEDQTSTIRSIGNRIYNGLASYVTNFPIQDLTSGFRAIKADLAQHLLYLLPNTYSYPTTLTLGILRSGRSIKYVRIAVKKRQIGKSGIRIIKDGIRFFMIIIRICTFYSPLKIFLPISMVIFLIGLGYYGYTFFTAGRFTNMSALLLTTSVLIFMLGLVSEQISQLRFEKSEGDRFV